MTISYHSEEVPAGDPRLQLADNSAEPLCSEIRAALLQFASDRRAQSLAAIVSVAGRAPETGAIVPMVCLAGPAEAIVDMLAHACAQAINTELMRYSSRSAKMVRATELMYLVTQKALHAVFSGLPEESA